MHVVVDDRITLPLNVQYYPTMYTWNVFFIHLSVDGHSGCLLFLWQLMP